MKAEQVIPLSPNGTLCDTISAWAIVGEQAINAKLGTQAEMELMRLVFVDGQVISPETWFQEGERVVVVREVDLRPITIVRAMERGTVVRVDPCTLYTEVRLDADHKGLRDYDNCLWVLPYDTPEILQALGRKPQTQWTPSFSRLQPSVA